MASNKKSYDSAHDHKQELTGGYKHSERFETDACLNMKTLKDLVSAHCYDEIVQKSKELFGEAFDYIFPSIEKALARGNGNVRRNILDLLDVESCRVCDVCGKLMEEGYLCEDSLQYSCSKRCLKKRNNWSEKEFRDWEKNWSDRDSLYWTEWY